jgi:hypothetical protein
VRGPLPGAIPVLSCMHGSRVRGLCSRVDYWSSSEDGVRRHARLCRPHGIVFHTISRRCHLNECPHVGGSDLPPAHARGLLAAVSRRRHRRPTAAERIGLHGRGEDDAADRSFQTRSDGKQCCRYDQHLDEHQRQQPRSCEASMLHTARFGTGACLLLLLRLSADGLCPCAPSSESGPWFIGLRRWSASPCLYLVFFESV